MSSEQILIIIVSSIISFVIGFIGPCQVFGAIKRAFKRKPAPILRKPLPPPHSLSGVRGPGDTVMRLPVEDTVMVGDPIFFQGHEAGRITKIDREPGGMFATVAWRKQDEESLVREMRYDD